MAASFQDLLRYLEAEEATLKALRCESLKACGVAVRSTVTEAFESLAAIVEEHFDELVAAQKSSLDAVLQSRAIREKPVWGAVGKNVWHRYFDSFDEKQLQQWKDWERMICVSDDSGATSQQQELVDKFLNMVCRRKEDLVRIGASSVQELFNVHARKVDVDLRFGFDFIRRVYPRISDDLRKNLTDALRSVLPQDCKVPVKKAHEAKLHSKETVLGDNLPRPRLPKSLRQSTKWTRT
eukprot:s1595_g14.t1